MMGFLTKESKDYSKGILVLAACMIGVAVTVSLLRLPKERPA